MESLLARKIELAAGGGARPDRPLIRTDSLDSTSSLGSLSSLAIGDDVCRCDDCLLGIADLYKLGEIETALTKKKVTFDIFGGEYDLGRLFQLSSCFSVITKIYSTIYTISI